MRTIYRKTKRGSVIKLIDHLTESTKVEFATEKFLYPKHLNPEELNESIASKKVFVGIFQTNRDNLLEGSVSIPLENGEDLHVLIQGRDFINRAVHDDQVAIELLPREQWRSKSNLVFLPEQAADENEEGSTNLLSNTPPGLNDAKPTGKVVGILKRAWRQYPGVLRRKRIVSTNMVRCLFIPSDRKIPVIRIETRQYNSLKNQRLLVAIDSWPRSSKYPSGHYIKSLGTIGDQESEQKALLLEHDIPHAEFTPEVLGCLPSKNWTIPDKEFSYRLDLRRENICSVDPPGCTDIDDALHYKDLGNNQCEVGVHIADVSYFVRPNTPIDLEAFNRSTSVYLADSRIDMIPGHLSSNLCSLVEKQDRLAFSVIWKLDKSTAQILDTKFTRSVINSKASLTYQRAQEMIDEIKNKGSINKSLRGLLDLSKKLKQKRIERGALCLARADEIRFVEIESEVHSLDANIEIQQKKMLDTNSMVEEFMLLANISVATHLVGMFPDFALLRRHPKPSKTNFDDLINSARVKGFEIDTDSGKSLSGTLDKAKLKNDDYFNLMLRMIATRCMTPASYFCSGCLDTQVMSYNHFGLAVDLYTHFTSPIRRYADLIVHRLLAHSLNYDLLDPKLTNKDNLQATCDKINYRHRMAQYASRASNKLHTILYIKSKKELIEDGYVFSVRQNAIQVLIPKIAYECTYFLQPLSDWKFDINNRTQTYLKSGIKLKQFDKLKVHITLSKEEVRFSEKIKIAIIKPAIEKQKPVDDTEVADSWEDDVMEVDIKQEFEICQDVDERPIANRDHLSAMKRKARLTYSLLNDKKPMIVGPGDDVSPYIKVDQCLLGPGLLRRKTDVIAIKSGYLKSRNSNIFWLDNHQKRYLAIKGDNIIGVVKSKSSLMVRVDINTNDNAALSLLAFENATKRNRPNLNVGDLVFAKILAAGKHIETELVCVSSSGKKDGLGQIGNKGGHLISVSLETARILLSSNCDFLKQLGQIYKYEVVVGLNGRIWINSTSPETVVKVANEIHKFDVC